MEGRGEDEHARDAEEGGEGARGDHLHDVDLDRVGGVRLRLSDGVVLEAEHDQLEHDAVGQASGKDRGKQVSSTGAIISVRHAARDAL